MSRPLRIEFEGAWYHVMNRGAAHKNIFYTDYHRQLFLNLLEEIFKKFKIEIHAYCLMSNHYHLMIRTPLANLQRAMRHLNGVYTQRFNQNKKTDGPLFRGRYKAILVDKESYLLQLNRYIHLNPVIAKLCSDPANYKWSSYPIYIGKRKRPEWLFIDEVLSRFCVSKQQNEYRLFINEGVDIKTIDFYAKPGKIPILGSDSFIKEIIKKYLKVRPINREVSEDKMIRKLDIPTIYEVIKIVSDYYNVSMDSIKFSRRGSENSPRSIAIYLATMNCQMTLTEIAKEFGKITHIGISNSYRRIIKRIALDVGLKNEIEILMTIVNSTYSS